ncbi:MAG TPA: hypothetical protein VHO84_02955 [Syntrophorhabdaceae bacterium]|nr:hypothetical protein [Syntrophorhabdaceae bacterium]
MGTQDNDSVKCPQCGSVMWPEDDHINEVRVLVCTKPTCLHRVYPDYPKRNGNQDICYLCNTVFTTEPDDLGVLCPDCKRTVKQFKKRTSSRQNGMYRPRETKNILHV